MKGSSVRWALGGTQTKIVNTLGIFVGVFLNSLIPDSVIILTLYRLKIIHINAHMALLMHTNNFTN